MISKVMFVVLIVLVQILVITPAFSQVPDSMSYQAVIRNTSSEIVSNSTIGMRISILQGGANGIPVYVESQTSSTNTNGLVSLKIGGGFLVSGSFSTINWANGPFFIKTETDLSGGTNYSNLNISQLLTVPYAFFAQISGNPISGDQGDVGVGFAHYIGEQYGGGVIFHLWRDSLDLEHGLIADLNDLSISQAWSNVMPSDNALSTWDGLSNSNSIVAQVGHTNSAAKLCLDLVSGGHSDWYLPSISEIRLLWQNRFNTNKTLSGISGATTLSNNTYWSSTEAPGFGVPSGYFTDATRFDFLRGITMNIQKNNLFYVRAIRAF